MQRILIIEWYEGNNTKGILKPRLMDDSLWMICFSYSSLIVLLWISYRYSLVTPY